MAIQIHTKTGREKEVYDILDAWKRTYPAKFRWFKAALQNMRQVQKNPQGMIDLGAGRETMVVVRAPAELWLFLQHRIPDWGKDSSDLELLLKIAGDYFKAGSFDRHKRVYSVRDQRAKKKKSERQKDENKRRNDSSGRGGADSDGYQEPSGLLISTR